KETGRCPHPLDSGTVDACSCRKFLFRYGLWNPNPLSKSLDSGTVVIRGLVAIPSFLFPNSVPLGTALPEAPLRERLTPNQIAWRACGTEITGVHIPVSIGGRYNTLRRPHLYPTGQNGQTNR